MKYLKEAYLCMKLSNDYILNKHMFLLSKDYAEDSIKAYLNFHKSHILEFEKTKCKDLLHFTDEEVKEVAKRIFDTLSPSSIRMIKSFIKKYHEWGIENNLDVNFKFDSSYFINTCTADWYINLDDFYEMCEKMLGKTSISNIIPLILARYGIVGDNLETMINLKWENVNPINLEVNVSKNGEVINTVPIDRRFICWLYIAKCSNFKTRGIIELDKGYVLRIKSHSKEDKVSYATVYTKQMIAFKSINMSRVNFKDLFNCRIIDLLHIKYKNNITLNNISDVLNILGDSPDTNATKLTMIKQTYGILTKNNIKIKAY
jgi:hypothetical protein